MNIKEIAAKVADAIGRIEVRILAWTRTLVTVVIVGAFVVGVLAFFSALSDVSASPDVTLDSGDIDVAEFDDSVRNVKVAPRQDDSDDRTESGQTPASEPDEHLYQEEINQMVSLLRPLCDAFELDVSRVRIESYLKDQIDYVRLVTERYTDSPSVSEDRLEDAVSGMVEYVEELVEHYADEIDLDEETAKAQKPIVGSFRAHAIDVLEHPLRPFVEKYVAASEELAAKVDDAKERAHARNIEGASNISSVGTIALVMLGGVLLLLVFKVEQSLRQYAEQGTGIGPAQSDKKQDAETHPGTQPPATPQP